MKLKLLFFMGILSVLFNTMYGQNTAPFFQVAPPNRVECPGYVAANVQYQVSDANTPAPDLVVSASAVGPQAVTFTYSQDPTGILRAINVTPVFPFVQGIVTVTLTLTDVGVPMPNLSSTAVFTVNFQDITPPVITSAPLVDIDEQINSGDCDFSVPDYVSLLSFSATDYCGGVTKTQTPIEGTVLSNHNTTQLVVLSATDDYGNVSSQSFTITLKDETPPTVITQNITVQLDGSGNVTITPNDVNDGSTDNCGTIASLILDITSFDCSNTGDNTVTLTAIDAAGNSATNTATVTVEDSISPTITCGSNITVNNDLGQCGALVSLTTPITSDNCGVDTVEGLRSDELSLSSEFPVGSTDVVWTVIDDSGNVSSCTQTVTVNDTENPNAVTQNITVYLDSDGEASITTSDINDGSTDNCDTSLTLSLDVTDFDCSDIGANTVTLTVTDDSGNSDTANATVTVVDDLNPSIATSGDVSQGNDLGQCGALITVSATATDNCSIVTPTGVRSDALLLTDEYPVGTTTIIWTATDGSGNTATTTQTVTINDVEAPVFASSFPDLVVTHDSGVCTYDTAQLSVPSVSDNCTPFSGVVTVTPSSLDVSAGPDHTPSIVTWTATDNYGNTVSATQSVLVQDLIAPIMRTKNITKYFDANGQIVILPSDIDDGSTDDSGNGCFTKYVVPNILYCGDKGANSVILTGTDLWGNQHYKEATVTAVDNINPTITAPASVVLNTNTACTWVGSLTLPTTADNCSVVSVTNDAPTAFSLGDTTVTWTVTDASGNTATATQTVTVNDTEKPVAIAKLGFVVELDDDGEATITATDIDNNSTDNCSIDTITISSSSFDCEDIGANVVTLTVTDESGNAASTTTIVTVKDVTAPSVDTQSYTATLSSTGTVTITDSDVIDSANDNCGIKSRTVSPNTFSCANLGPNTVTVTVTDNSNNVTTETATVTVVDTTNPTISVTDITVNTNAGCTWNGTLALPTTADNCSVASVTSDKAIDFAYPIGDTDVVWTVTDVAGNTASATQTVTVVDTEKPIAIASDITIKLSALGTASIIVADINNGSSDNCGIKAVDGLVLSKSDFNCSNVGSNTVVLTVTDTSDNESKANAIVTVIDDILPVITSSPAIAVNTSTGICGANVTIVPATATDNCTVGSPIGTRSDAKALTAVYPLGRTIITWNVNDANGNAAVPVTQTVDVTDAQVPVITSNGNKTANADLGECGAIVTVSATATDNCSVGTPVGVRSDAKPLAAAYPVGTTTITWNVTDVNGNAAVAVTQTVTVTDTQKPVIMANGNKFVNSDAGQCGALVMVSATAADNCSVGTPVGVRFFNGSVTPDGLPVTAPYAVGTTVIRWNVTDVNSNTAVEVVQTVVVKDIQIPVINGTITTINANTDATVCAATVSVTAPTASDNCTVGSPIGTRSDNLALNALYPIGTTTITWNVTDINGNVALSTTTSVKVKDATAPTVITKNITISLNVSGTASIVAADVNNGSTDACGIASYSINRTSFSCSDTGAPKTVTLTVIDIYGNVGTGTALVTVTEPIIPIARTRNITVQLNAAGTVSIEPSDINNGSTDNCGIVSYSINNQPTFTFNCSNVGANIVNLTATDASGNNSVPAQATVTVQDKVAPVVITKSYTAQLNAAGTVTITAADVNNGSTDACGIATYSISKSTFVCDNVGENIITLTATDVNGNVGQAFATVIVQDVTAPVVVTRNIELVLDRDSVSITPADVLVSATDACGVDVLSYSLSQDTFTIVDVLASPVTITVYATDVNGNVGSSTAVITFPTRPTDVIEAITPNGDGIHDTWVISNITNHPNSIVRVYNRWGSMVYSAKNYQNNWDGKVNGSDATLPDGQAYYYQIDLEGTGSIDEQGWLYITRQ